MNVVLNIGDREALPLRAIPYVTSWNESPDSIVHALAKPKYIHLYGRDIPNRYALTAYQMNERGGYEEISASQWEQVEVTLDCATKKHQADERNGYEDENWAAWRISTTLSLPDYVFVWLDEFRQWYSTTRPLVEKVSDGEFRHDDIREKLLVKLHDPDSELSESEWAMRDADRSDCGQEDDSLCLSPLLPPEVEGKLWRFVEECSGTDISQLPERTKEPEVPRLRAQEEAIIAKLRELSYDPKALPPNQPGKPGVRAEIRKALSTSQLFEGTTTFASAWERLSIEDIAYAKA